jgi:hypothetical protein
LADDSELDYIRTFVGSVMTGYTIKHYTEIRNINLINDTQRGLVYPGTILTVNDVYFESRYLLKLSDATEAALTTGIKNLITGTKNYNRRLTGPTQVASMTHISVVFGNQAYEHGSTKRWNQDLNLDVIWSVA